MSISLIVLLAVFLGIALRQLFRIPLQIWQMMTIGAGVVLLTGQISLPQAWESIEWNVIFFLFGMFVVGQALEESGAFGVVKCSLPVLGLLIIFGSGLLSAILMNDTVAIIGTPLLVAVARQRGLSLERLLLLLAFSVTIGSVMSPIGNPQNLFIAVNADLSSPFKAFFRYLALPTLINLLLLFFLFFFLMRKEKPAHLEIEAPPVNPPLKNLAYIALALIFLLIAFNIAAPWRLPLSLIALIPAALILFFSPERKRILSFIDWHTLVFFMAMFILMESVWRTSALKHYLPPFEGEQYEIMLVSLLLSQLISNVPMVALYLPVLQEQSQEVASLMSLACGSTIAGNFLIFGAASNIIIIQNAEKRGEKAFSFFQFAKYGIPFTLVNLFVYWVFIKYAHQSS